MNGACSCGPKTPVLAVQRGGLLIEVLVSIVLCAFALLGFVMLQSRATSAEFEAVQRSQALVLLEDMAARINTNRADAGAYVSQGLIGAGSVQSCTGLSGAAMDLCEWGNLIRGSAELRSGSAVGSMTNARGCITRAANTTDRYVVSVAWQGLVPSGAPTAGCGQSDAAFPEEARRRVVSTTVCIARIRDPDTPVIGARC